METTVLPSTVKDANEVLALQKLAYQMEAEIYNDFTIQPLVQTLDELKDEYRMQTVLKVQMDDTIAGSVRAYLEGDTCYIGKLIVHPSFQNKGIGKTLLQAAENLFPDTQRFELFTGDKSEKNLYLYTKSGYKAFKQILVTPNITLIFLEKNRSN